MKRLRTPRLIAARTQYISDCARYGLAQADELAQARQPASLEPLRFIFDGDVPREVYHD